MINTHMVNRVNYFRLTMFEVLAEAFPQATLGLYRMMVLRQTEILNCISVTLSSLSLIYGIADSVTYWKFDETAPFSKVVFSFLSGIIDTLFRLLLISFISSIFGFQFLVLIPVMYYMIFYSTIGKSKF